MPMYGVYVCILSVIFDIQPIPLQVRAFLEPPIEGVVLETYGAGNGPDSRQDLLEEIKTAVRRGVIIVNCTQCLQGHVVDDYSTGRVRFYP